MYQLLVSDESRLDILDAFSWYESRRHGLGRDFELCLEAGLIRYKGIHFYFKRI